MCLYYNFHINDDFNYETMVINPFEQSTFEESKKQLEQRKLKIQQKKHKQSCDKARRNRKNKKK